jgi:hypothetical protein
MSYKTGKMLQTKTVQSVLNKHKKRDGWFLDDYSFNPYEGAEKICRKYDLKTSII